MQGDDSSTVEAAPGRGARVERGEARRANSTPNGGRTHLELGRSRLKPGLSLTLKSGFSIAQTARQHICTWVYTIRASHTAHAAHIAHTVHTRCT